MTEQKNGMKVSPGTRGPWTEASFEDIAEVALAVELDAAAEAFRMGGGKGSAGIDG